MPVEPCLVAEDASGPPLSDKSGNVTKVPYQEHVPPDVTAQIFWLKNRDPAHWRDAWQVDHTLGKSDDGLEVKGDSGSCHRIPARQFHY
jgi:hypothetical protein